MGGEFIKHLIFDLEKAKCQKGATLLNFLKEFEVFFVLHSEPHQPIGKVLYIFSSKAPKLDEWNQLVSIGLFVRDEDACIIFIMCFHLLNLKKVLEPLSLIEISGLS